MKITGDNLTIQDVYEVAVKGTSIELDSHQLEQVASACERVQKWGSQSYPIYGVNTGFGELAHIIIPADCKTKLQMNLLRSHAAGGGEMFPDYAVRAMMLARVNCFMKGYSGVSVEAVGLIREFLNRGIHPVVPQQGSLGASGDLAPLSHLALPLIAEGEVRVNGKVRPSAEVLAEEKLKPLELGYKEALALINGTSGMTGLASLMLERAYLLLQYSVLATAAFVQCLEGSTRAFEERGHKLKNHKGQTAVANSLSSLLEGSKLTHEHSQLMQMISAEVGQSSGVVDTPIFLQNAYTLRCVPQILGPVLDTFDFCRRLVEEELNSCNDNPLIFNTPQECFHGGHFHGQYVAMACDYLNIALTEVGVLVDRQLNRLLDPHLNGSLPPFLADGPGGLFCGYEGAQYLVTSIASENLDLASPASVKSIPSNGSNQDVVSMGLIAARKSMQLTRNLTSMLSVMYAACFQAAQFVGPEKFSLPLQQMFELLGRSISRYQDDVPMYRLINAVRAALESDEFKAHADFHVVFGEYSYSRNRS